MTIKTNNDTSAKQLLTPTEAAALFNVSTVTLRNWEDKYNLLSKKTLGGHRRYRLSDLLQFAQDNNLEPALAQRDSSVMIVDDDEAFVEFLGDWFKETFSMPILSAQNALEAGLKLSQFKPDVVIVDWYLPGETGDGFCKRVLATSGLEHTKIIGVSGSPSAEMEETFIESGARCLIKKPLNLGKLKSILEEFNL